MDLHGNDPCSHRLRGERIAFMLEVRETLVDHLGLDPSPQRLKDVRLPIRPMVLGIRTHVSDA